MSERPNVLRERPVEDLFGPLAGAVVRAMEPAQLVAGGRWAVRFGRYPYAKVVTVLSGSCWLRPDGHAPLRLTAGDCYLLEQQSGYLAGSDPDVEPEASGPLFSRAANGVAVTGAPAGGTRLLGVPIQLVAPSLSPLLDGLGPTLVDDAHTAATVHATLRLLADEHRADQPGGAAMRLHLTQILYLQLLRHLLADGTDVPDRLAAFRDPRIGAALAAIHHDPARPWTVATLAAQALMSRTVFAERFKALLGISPMDYVLQSRITGATSDLAEGRTVASTARRWGYRSESAFSAAYKRITGRPPSSSRRC